MTKENGYVWVLDLYPNFQQQFISHVSETTESDQYDTLALESERQTDRNLKLIKPF